MASRLIPSAAAALRRRQDPKLADKFNLATLNAGKSPFDVPSNRLLKVNKTHKTPQQKVTDKFSLEYLLGDASAKTADNAAKKNPFNVASNKLK